jgi:hypothetical protein
MIPIPAAFSGSYAEARTKFLEGAASLGLRIHSHLHPLKGRDGETLAMDVVRDGPADADRLLIVSSACHGVEGYCGSGVQVAALADAEWREKARAQGVAVLYIHALNPYGFSHIRSVTQENVDLNRNFHDFSQACRSIPRTGTCSRCCCPNTGRPGRKTWRQLRLSSPSAACRHSRPPCPEDSMNFPTACFLAAPRPPGATRLCAPCCDSTRRA